MSARARGFIEAWHPRAETWELLCRIKQVLDEYVEQLPLTLRQIFCILVGRHAYEKTERAYERLCETPNKARRGKVIDMDAVRDDGFTNEIRNFLQQCQSSPKPTNRRRSDGNEMWEAEALDPRDIAEIVRRAIEERLDQDRLTSDSSIRARTHCKRRYRRAAAGQGRAAHEIAMLQMRSGELAALCGRRNCSRGNLSAGTKFSCIGLTSGGRHD